MSMLLTGMSCGTRNSLWLILFVVICCGALENNLKFDCYPENPGVNETDCLKRGCEWENITDGNPTNVPLCYYVEESPYKITNVTKTTLGETMELKLRKQTHSEKYPDLNMFTKPMVHFEAQTPNRLRIKITDSVKRYEVPVQDDFPQVKSKPQEQSYHYDYRAEQFSIQIYAVRNSQNIKIWDTDVGAMILSDQFLQISTELESNYLYGFGENSRSSFKRDFSKWHSIGMFTKDAAPYPFHNTNLYGVHPFYLMMESNGAAHGVLLLNSNAMDVTLQPTPALTYRTIGGVLDFYFFFGPTAENVIQQYTELIGRPVMPSYWSLGFQLCRYGYNSLDEVKKTVARMSKYDIPQDVQYGDIDYMERQLDFTYDNNTYNGLPDFVRQIKKQGIKYITILDPAISAEEPNGTYEPYELGNTLDIWIKDETGNASLFGKVWPDRPNIFVNKSWPWDKQTEYFRANATFPDWFHPKIESWWNVLIKKFHMTLPFDGLWIDMNEAANFVKGSIHGCPENKYESPPYKPKISSVLADKTLCMSALHANGEKEYNYHSLFGWKQTVVTRKALTETTGKRGIVISRSTYPSSGKYAGHWLGDNKSDWPQMHESIIGMFDFTLFGMPYSGADICGFNEDTTESLCHRWMQLGAFYPMSRNHNGINFKPQDPAVFGEEFAKNAKDILHIRYKLLPYMYTLFYEAHVGGNSVVRPMFFEFPNDLKTWNVDRQFLLGPSLLITPVLEKGATSAKAYFPKDLWFDYYTGHKAATGQQTLNIPHEKIGLHLRGGRILPTQEAANNTKHSRLKPMGLVVVLDSQHKASGSLFWDDGDSLDSISGKKHLLLHFNASETGLRISVQVNGYNDAANLFFNKINVLGLQDKQLSDVVIDGKTHLDETSHTGQASLEGLKMVITSDHEIKWKLKNVISSATKNRESVGFSFILTFLIYYFNM